MIILIILFKLFPPIINKFDKVMLFPIFFIWFIFLCSTEIYITFLIFILYFYSKFYSISIKTFISINLACFFFDKII